MFDFTDIKLKDLVIHKVGNKFRNEGIFVSDGLHPMENDNLKDLLLKYFLQPFKNSIFYKFYHETDIELNEVHNYINRIFKNTDVFYNESINILKHLYNKSTHPNIKNGEFYMCYLKDCIVDDMRTDAIGIFKSETKDVFLKINQNENNFELNYEKGINIKNLDKGCLIFKNIKSCNYKVSIVDTARSGNEAVYWKKEFLNLQVLKDNDSNTKALINLCKDFNKNIYSKNPDNDKREQIVFLNKSLNYFKTHDRFDFEEFSEEVLEKTEHRQDLKKYTNNYKFNDLEPDKNFNISNETFNKEKRKVKCSIKLDNAIEINISSDEAKQSKIIEKGYDESKKMHFYKIFYNEEK
ncbi:MAG: nucleoid-associated protein [Tepidibacter sp.]|jgi:hypothetical protein|uniref:nucleoid-associated protein n=1 Tax=Tepidibacter sp. TaxID=2529387 RepID=UPI0025E4A355|nr:nucleoid-associated protein [Tepidibacter sp.]MCT4509159.1 nucleoid-associated protein [Tepidibacter sp.]